MKKLLSFALYSLLTCMTALHATAGFADEKPVQHLIVDDITTYENAQVVFADTTAQLKTKTTLDAAQLHDIHMITYSLEKAIAYFADNLEGDQQAASKKMAAVVELVHLASENNRKEETEVYLQEYFSQADAFAQTL